MRKKRRNVFFKHFLLTPKIRAIKHIAMQLSNINKAKRITTVILFIHSVSSSIIHAPNSLFFFSLSFSFAFSHYSCLLNFKQSYSPTFPFSQLAYIQDTITHTVIVATKNVKIMRFSRPSRQRKRQGPFQAPGPELGSHQRHVRQRPSIEPRGVWL